MGGYFAEFVLSQPMLCIGFNEGLSMTEEKK